MSEIAFHQSYLNTLRPRQNGRHFADDILKCIFLNENVWISIKISLKFVPKGPINNIPSLVQIMAWRRPGDKPLSEPMMVSLPTHICVTRLQWVKSGSCLRLCIAFKNENIYKHLRIYLLIKVSRYTLQDFNSANIRAHNKGTGVGFAGSYGYKPPSTKHTISR